MKKLSFLFAFILFAAFSISSANAQTMQYKYETSTWWWIPCTGEYVSGDVSVHVLFHLDSDGFFDWEKVQAKGKNLVSDSGESFKLNYKYNWDVMNPGDNLVGVFFHYTLKGDMGTTFTVMEKWSYNLVTGEYKLIMDKVECN